MSKSNTDEASPESIRGLSIEVTAAARPGPEQPQDRKFDDELWNLHQAVVWLALGNRDAVDKAGHEPGSHVLEKIDNSLGGRMSADEAEDAIMEALSDGRVASVKLVDGKKVPVPPHEWVERSKKPKRFNLSPGATWGWWLGYFVRRDDVMKLLLPAGNQETATGSVMADTTAKIKPKKMRKAVGKERFIAALVALHKAGTDISGESDKGLHRAVLRHMGKTGEEHGMKFRTFERALAEWKESAGIGQ